MPGEVETTLETPLDAGPPLGSTPPAAAPATPPAPAAPAPGQGNTVVVPTAAMAKIKQQQYEKGRAEALTALATEAGFATPQELTQALARLKSAPAPAAPAAPATPAQPAAAEPGDDLDPAAERERRRQEGKQLRNYEKVLNERNRYAQEAAAAKAQAEQYKQEVEAKQAEMHLRTLAAQTGIKDIDYAVVLISRQIDELTPEQLEKFNEKEFFEGLRQTKPLLFGEAVVPANTGTGGGSAPTPPPPGRVNPAGNANTTREQIRAMKPADYQAELRKRGINPLRS